MKVFVYKISSPWTVAISELETRVFQEFNLLEHCDLEHADIALIPIPLASVLQLEVQGNATVGYQWRQFITPQLQNSQVPHVVVCAGPICGTLAFLPTDIFVLSPFNEVVTESGIRGNLGCDLRMIGIPPIVENGSFQLLFSEHPIVYFGAINDNRTLVMALAKHGGLKIVESELQDFSKLSGKLVLVLKPHTFFLTLLYGGYPVLPISEFSTFQNLFPNISLRKFCVVIPEVGSFQWLEHTIFRIREKPKQPKMHEPRIEEPTCSEMFDYSKGALLSSLQTVFSHKPHFRVFIAELPLQYQAPLPVKVTSRDIVAEDCTSQYAVEVYFHQMVRQHFLQTKCVEEANVVFIPFYTFLKGWNDGFSFARIRGFLQSLIRGLWSWQHTNIPHVIVYSDVSWKDREDFFTNHISFPTNTVFVSLESISIPNVRSLTVPYLPGFAFVKEDRARNVVLTYIGRGRIPFVEDDPWLDWCNIKFVEMDGWKSINEVAFMERCKNEYCQSLCSIQPPGDQGTRRGFYQSLLCGCVPIIFPENRDAYAQHCEFPIDEIAYVMPLSVMKYSTQMILDHIFELDYQEILIRKQHFARVAHLYEFDFHGNPVLEIMNKVVCEKLTRFE